MTMESLQVLLTRVAISALDLYRAEASVKAEKVVLSGMYHEFFCKHGRPKGKFTDDNDDFLPVMVYTNSQYAKVQAKKRQEYNAKRRHKNAVKALDRHYAQQGEK